MAEDKKYWLGETRCNICGKECGDTLYDSRMTGLTMWAVMCEPCHKVNGLAPRQGQCQAYMLEDGKYIKVAG